MPQEIARRAREAWVAEDWRQSAALYEQAALEAPADPRIGDWWYDAALAHKFLRDWPQAYRLGVKAAAHAPRGQQDPAFWNLGIAATILRDWTTARDAWDGYGVSLAPGDGPIDGKFGQACVRLSTAEGHEVVWVQRLCPTRARVVSVPFAVSRRFGEIVVHDGEPKGDRVVDGRTYRVFDELMVFEPSAMPTLAVTVTAAQPADLDALADALSDSGFGFEPLANGQRLCRCCSEGRVDQQHLVLSGEQRCLIAAPADEARTILDNWRAQGTREWRDLHPAA